MSNDSYSRFTRGPGTETYEVLTVDAVVIEVAGYTAEGGVVVVGDGERTHAFDLVAGRRLARVLLQAAEEAEPADPHPELRYAGTVEIHGKPWHLTIDEAMRLAKAALERGEKL